MKNVFTIVPSEIKGEYGLELSVARKTGTTSNRYLRYETMRNSYLQYLSQAILLKSVRLLHTLFKIKRI